MAAFHKLEEALEDLKKGKIILVTMMRNGKMKGILSAQHNSQQRKILTLWRPTEKG